MSMTIMNIARWLDFVYYGLLLQVITIFTPLIVFIAIASGAVNPLQFLSISAYVEYGIAGVIIISNLLIIVAKYFCMVGSHDVPGAATNASLSLFLQVVSFFVGMIAAGFDSWIFPMILKSEFLPPIVMIRAMASLKTILGWSQTVLIVFSVLSFVLFLRDVSNYIGYQEGSQKASALRTRVINLLTISVVIVVLSLLMLMALVYPGLLGFLAFFGLAVPVLIVGVAILGLFAFFSYARLILNVAAKVRSFSLLEASAAAPDELGPKATIAKL